MASAAKKAPGAKTPARGTGEKARGGQAVEEPEVPEVVGTQAAYERFLPEAKKLPEGDVIPFRADAALAYHNAVRARDAVVAEQKVVEASGLKVDWKKLGELPELALAVGFAAAQVMPDEGDRGEVAALLKEARGLRTLLLVSAESLAHAGLLPAKKVSAIRAGQGPFDTAQDCVDLAALFSAHADQVKGHTAVRAAHLKAAARVGSELLARLKPKGASRKKARSPEALALVDARDRLWTLLVGRFEVLERVAGSRWGRALGEHVPSLQSRYVAAKRAKKP